MAVTAVFDILTANRLVQFWNAPLPKVVNEEGSVRVPPIGSPVKLVQ